MALQMPDIDLSHVPPGALAEIDQAHSSARGEVAGWTDDARRFLDRYGPTYGPGLLAESLIAACHRDVDALAGGLAIALVELVRREAGGG